MCTQYLLYGKHCGKETEIGNMDPFLNKRKVWGEDVKCSRGNDRKTWCLLHITHYFKYFKCFHSFDFYNNSTRIVALVFPLYR